MKVFTFQELENLIKGFVEATLENESPCQMCFTMSYLLSNYLMTHSIKHSIISGTVNIKNRSIPHYILLMKDYEQIIVDPTVQQIDKEFPCKVFMGKLSSAYVSFGAFNFDEVFNDWIHPLLNSGKKKTLQEKFPMVQLPADANVLIQIDILPYLKILRRSKHLIFEKFENLKKDMPESDQEALVDFFTIANYILKEN